MSYLEVEECRPHILQGQILRINGTAEKLGHHVVSGMAVGQPSLRNDDRSRASSTQQTPVPIRSQTERAHLYDQGSSCSAGSTVGGTAQSTLLGT